jgi:hypothetical protein
VHVQRSPTQNVWALFSLVCIQKNPDELAVPDLFAQRAKTGRRCTLLRAAAHGPQLAAPISLRDRRILKNRFRRISNCDWHYLPEYST